VFTIRPLHADDLPAALDLWARAKGVELSEGDSPAELARYLDRNPGASQLALVGEEAAGAVLAGHDGRRGFLYHLAVAPAFQGEGIGRALVERATAELKAQGISRVLILVARDNDEGRRFWQNGGWDEMEFARPMGLDL
jgi:ribosomal protein S18 acetylase RimI-like enzyme